jgi:DNA-directed RNA polymerase subunit L
LKVPVAEVEIVEQSENLLKLKLKGQRTTLAVLLAKYLAERDDVNFAAWDIDHPESDYAYLIIRAQDPKKALKETIRRLLQECDSLENSLQQELKKISSRSSK